MTFEILQGAANQALKDGNKERRSAISGFIAQIKKVAIDNGCRDNIPEDLVNAELLKIKKSIQEQIDTCPITRTDLMNKYSVDMAIVNEFAPVVINDDIIIYDAIVRIAGTVNIDKKQRGMVMKAMKGEAANGVFYDMTVVNKVLTRMMEG